MPKNKVSVVIPVFNRADLVSDAIKSAINQSYENIEIIVVDDGSTDLTGMVVQQFSAVRYFWQENRGQGAARNKGILKSTGDFIAFLDSDDLWLPEKISRQVEFLHKNKQFGMVYSDCEYFEISESGNPIKKKVRVNPHQGWISKELFLENFIASCTPLVRREVFEECGVFNESALLRCREDWEMWLRIASRFQIGYMPETLAKYRFHSENSTRSEDLKLVFKSYGEVIKSAINFAPECFSLYTNLAQASRYFKIGKGFATLDEIHSTRRFFRKAILYNPFEPDYFLSFLATITRTIRDSLEKLIPLIKNAKAKPSLKSSYFFKFKPIVQRLMRLFS
ncbi:MAG: glycosyltransferase [Candidatus Riflebacteria bacterium]|nr:glycosyltransferase [Candidatus Riflebacteria bacterium]